MYVHLLGNVRPFVNPIYKGVAAPPSRHDRVIVLVLYDLGSKLQLDKGDYSDMHSPSSATTRSARIQHTFLSFPDSVQKRLFLQEPAPSRSPISFKVGRMCRARQLIPVELRLYEIAKTIVVQ